MKCVFVCVNMFVSICVFAYVRLCVCVGVNLCLKKYYWKVTEKYAYFFYWLHLYNVRTSIPAGSWGDNELSPECLDGAQVFLKSDGLSIPSSYTSFVGEEREEEKIRKMKKTNEIKIIVQILYPEHDSYPFNSKLFSLISSLSLSPAPMSSSKLWMGARSQSAGSSSDKGLNTPYVVKFHNHFMIDEAKPLFRFDHPNLLPPELIDNSR